MENAARSTAMQSTVSFFKYAISIFKFHFLIFSLYYLLQLIHTANSGSKSQTFIIRKFGEISKRRFRLEKTEKSPSGIIPVRAFDIVCLVKYEMIRNQLLCRSSST